MVIFGIYVVGLIRKCVQSTKSTLVVNFYLFLPKYSSGQSDSFFRRFKSGCGHDNEVIFELLGQSQHRLQKLLLALKLSQFHFVYRAKVLIIRS